MSEWKETDYGRIPKRWNTSTLGELCTLLTDGSHTSPKPIASEYRMASVKDMRYNHFEFSDCKTISKEDFDELVKNNCKPNKGDILLSKDGANCLDIIFVYNQEEEIVLLSSIAIARLKPDYNPNFIRYFLLSPGAQQMMRNNYVSGSAIPRVILKDFRNVPVPLPIRNEQDQIAEILSSLDDKIDLLHRQNKTLEQMAETLWRQWFVEEAEESWAERSLDQVAEYLNGLACQKYPVQLGEIGLPVIKIKEMKNGITDSSDLATANVPEKYLIKDGDMLFSWSGSLEIVLWFGGTGVLNQHLFKVTSDHYPQWFIYYWTRYHLEEFKAIAVDKATTMGHIQRHHLSDAKVLVPTELELKHMSQSVEPVFQKLKINNQQISSLTQLRDSLLPKLMSGDIPI